MFLFLQQEEVISPPVKRSSRLQRGAPDPQEQAQKENVPPPIDEPPQTPGAPPTPAAPPVSAEDAVFGQATSVSAENPQTPHHQVQQPSTGGLENLGYDQTNPNNENEMTNFGYTGEGAPTPGAVSMGGATPYRYKALFFFVILL